MLPTLTFIYDRKGRASKTTPAVVELKISADGQRTYISTGIKLLPKEWSNGSVIGRKDWKELNDQLQMVKKKCSEIIVDMVDEGNLDIKAIPSILKGKIVRTQTFIEYCEYLAEEKYKTIASGTKKHYTTLFNFLKEWNGIVSFSQVNGHNIMKMDRELEDRGLSEDTRWNYHKRIKMFCDKAVEDGLIKKNPYHSLDISRGQNKGLSRFLTPNEFHRFETCEIDKKKYDRIRDLFVFQTYTMMAFSDLEAFRKEKCTKVGGKVVYKARRKKTHQEFVVVLLKPALAILKKYKGRLPMVSNVKYNLYLKEAVKYAKIKKPVSTHWARHTGATLLLNEGKVPIHIIQHILGHASIRETERTYAKLMDNTIVEAMTNYEVDM